MSIEFDRLKRAIADVVRASVQPVDYLACYRARVIAQSLGLDTVDLVPDDPRLPPSIGGVPLVVPAGVTVKIHIPKAGEQATYALIGWSGGDPTQPYAIPFAGAGMATTLVLDADQVFVGGQDGAEPAIKGQSFADAQSQFMTALVTYATAIAGIADPSGTATTALGNAVTKFVTLMPSTFAAKASVT